MTAPPRETYEGTWLEIRRGSTDSPWWYVTKCDACLDFAERLQGSMSGELWSQRGKILLAFGLAHHAMAFDEVKPLLFFRDLQAHGWPDALLREVAELMFDADLNQPAGSEPLIVRETRVVAMRLESGVSIEQAFQCLVGEFREERRQRLGASSD